MKIWSWNGDPKNGEKLGYKPKADDAYLSDFVINRLKLKLLFL